jgi:hypothetical protein
MEAAALKEQRDNLMLETKRQAANIVAMENERDVLNLEAEEIRGKCTEAAALNKDRDRLILETKRQAANIVAIEKEKDNFETSVWKQQY